MNVPVEHRHGAETSEHRQSLLAIRGSPTPLRIYRPQGNVREHDNGRAGGNSLEILFQPVELVLSDLAQAFELNHVIQSHEVDPLVIEALPAPAGSVLAEPFHVLLAVISSDIVLS